MGENLAPPSGLGEARPAFVHDMAAGVTSTPQIPTLHPAQFGVMPNWHASGPPEVKSALITPQSGG